MAVSRYPGKRYHATEPARYVQNEADDAALGAGWFDSPEKAAAAPVVEDAPVVVDEPKARKSRRVKE
jgi:hypothetical protein